MKNHSSRTSLHPFTAFTGSARRGSVGLWLVLASCALGCAREGVDLGGNTLAQDVRRGSRCVDSLVVEENIVVSQQEELDALAGCEEIQGNLIVRAFAGADLAPLGALRRVEGQFALGVRENWEEIAGFSISDRLDPQVDLLRAGWVESLEGVQALEHADALFLRGMPDADLTAFESLASIGGGGRPLSGMLILQQNLNLTDLGGLEDLAGLNIIAVTLSPELVSVNGLDTSELSGISLYTSPVLGDLSALTSITSLDALTLFQIGVTDLNALSGLRSVKGLSVAENLELVDASGLGGLQSAENIIFASNAALKQLPSFANFTLQPSTIAIQQNPALESAVLDFTNAPTRTYDIATFVGQREVEAYELGLDVIDIRNNAKLASVSVPGGLTKAHLMLVGENPSLTSIDFGSLTELGQLSVTSNPALTEVAPGDLAQVGFLEVTNNPLLSPAVFDDVQAFAREISGNAD